MYKSITALGSDSRSRSCHPIKALLDLSSCTVESPSLDCERNRLVLSIQQFMVFTPWAGSERQRHIGGNGAGSSMLFGSTADHAHLVDGTREFHR
jgi:hypothetical protein